MRDKRSRGGGARERGNLAESLIFGVSSELPAFWTCMRVVVVFFFFVHRTLFSDVEALKVYLKKSRTRALEVFRCIHFKVASFIPKMTGRRINDYFGQIFFFG